MTCFVEYNELSHKKVPLVILTLFFVKLITGQANLFIQFIVPNSLHVLQS